MRERKQKEERVRKRNDEERGEEEGKVRQNEVVRE